VAIAEDQQPARIILKALTKDVEALKYGAATDAEFAALDYQCTISYTNCSLATFLPQFDLHLWPQTAAGCMIVPPGLPASKSVDALKLVLDRESSGANMGSRCEQQLVSMCSYDGFHDLWNIVKEALKASMLWGRVGLLVLMCNVLHGRFLWGGMEGMQV
jgi:hypothetical protein